LDRATDGSDAIGTSGSSAVVEGGVPLGRPIPFEGVPELDTREERAAETSREALIQEHRQDLLMFPVLGRVLKWRGLQPSLEVPGVILFVLVVVVGIWGTQEPSQNLATMLVWIYWWSLVIFSFIFVGRIWCMMCPLGAVGEWVHRRIGTLGRRWPRRLRNLWPAHIFFIGLTGLDMVVGIDTLPGFTGAFILGLIVMAVVFGVVYERRTFCRYLCPIGGMCGIYSMTSTLELRVKSPSRCESCLSKECIKGTEHSFGCPWFEYPGEMDRNNYCTMCLECVRGCPHENIGLMVRPPGQDLWRTNTRVFDEVILAVGLIGVMASHTIATTQPFQDWVTSVEASNGIPAWAILTLVYALSIVLANGAYLGASALAARLTSTDDRRLDGRTVFRWTGYALIPLALSMHLARNVPFLSIWGMALLDVVRNMALDFPLGFDLVRTQNLLPDDAVWLVKMVVIMLGFIFSAYAAYRLSLRMQPRRKLAGRLMAAIILIMIAFTVVYVWILSLPLVA
jgi:polyferredoxin